MTLIKTLLFKLLACIISVSTVAASGAATPADLLLAAAKGFTHAYTEQERVEMDAQWIFSNENNKFELSTNEAAKEIIRAVLIQFMTGEADKDAVISVLDSLPRSDITHSYTPKNALLSNETIDALQSAILDSGIVPDALKPFLSMQVGGIHDLYVYLQPTDKSEIFEIKGSYVADDGETISVVTGAYYDSSTGMVYGGAENGILGVGYDYDARQYMLQCPHNCWMRGMGYNIGYDILGEILFMDCETERIRFTYGGKNYMLQIWKGNYTSFTNGAEIGLYYLEDGAVVQYTCVGDDDLLDMSMELSNNGKILFSRPLTHHWWMCGFQAGPAVHHDDLLMKSTVIFKNDEMASAFAAAAKSVDGLQLSRDGSTVSVSWQ